MLSVLSAQFESRFFVDVRMVPLNGSAIFIHIGLNLRLARKKRKKRFVVFEFFFALSVGDNELWDRSSHLRSSLGTKIISSALSTKMAAWKTRELFWVIAGD